MVGPAEVQAVLSIRGGHEIPSCAATTNVIEGREFPCDEKRLLVGCCCRGDQPDVLRHCGDDREQSHRFEHRWTIGWRGGREKLRLVHPTDAIAVGQKDKVQFGGLHHLRHLDRVLNIHDRFGPRFRMLPSGKMRT
jgi:hypothetical protein